jgi:hypothetical protein
MDQEMNTVEINYDLHRYPFCLVWTPIPLITWIFPFIGHMGIATSQGLIRDFAGEFVKKYFKVVESSNQFLGPYVVSKDDMGFAWPTRYLVLDVEKVEGGAKSWDGNS